MTTDKFQNFFFSLILIAFSLIFLVSCSSLPSCDNKTVLKDLENLINNKISISKRKSAAAVGSLKTMGLSLMFGETVSPAYKKWVDTKVKINFDNFEERESKNRYSCKADIFFTHSLEEILAVPYEPASKGLLGLGMAFSGGTIKNEMNSLSREMRLQISKNKEFKQKFGSIRYQVTKIKSKEGKDYKVTFTTYDLREKLLTEYFSNFIIFRYLNTF